MQGYSLPEENATMDEKQAQAFYQKQLFMMKDIIGDVAMPPDEFMAMIR